MTPNGDQPVGRETRVVSAENTLSFRRLDALGELVDNWDSYGGAPPTPLSLETARRLLLKLDRQCRIRLGRDVDPFHIAPLPSGGVQLEWTGSSKDIEVEVGPDGRLAYLLIDRSGDERRFTEDEEVPATTVLELVVSALTS